MYYYPAGDQNNRDEVEINNISKFWVKICEIYKEVRTINIKT